LERTVISTTATAVAASKSYLAIIETAGKHGWIDAQANAISAHGERSI